MLLSLTVQGQTSQAFTTRSGQGPDIGEDMGVGSRGVTPGGAQHLGVMLALPRDAKLLEKKTPKINLRTKTEK
jgi:hypothetical protein